MKKTLSLLLSLIMVATTLFALPFSANAGEIFTRVCYNEANRNNYASQIELFWFDDGEYNVTVSCDDLASAVGYDVYDFDEINWWIEDTNGNWCTSTSHCTVPNELPKSWTSNTVTCKNLKNGTTYRLFCIGVDENGNYLRQPDYFEFRTLGAKIDATTFPDKNFRDVVKAFDANHDDELTPIEISYVEDIVIEDNEIKDFTGIEYFEKLQNLQIENNPVEIEKFDISQNKMLCVLRIVDANISSLDISNNTLLLDLSLLDTNISKLDLSNNAALEQCILNGNLITEIDITNTKVLIPVDGYITPSAFIRSAFISCEDLKPMVVYMTAEQKKNVNALLEQEKDEELNYFYSLAVLHDDHIYTTKTTKATTSKDGKIVKECPCGKTTSSTIKKVSTVKLSATSYVYDGKVKSPTLTVKDSSGKSLVKGTDYTVTVPTGRKNVGKYTYKITFKGKYSGTKTLNFTIVPKATSISSLTATSKGFTAKWKKQATQTTGYQIRYSTKSSMASAKTVTVSKNSTVSKKITKLTGKKKYYVQVRTYKTVSGTKYYSAWSKAKTVTTKK